MKQLEREQHRVLKSCDALVLEVRRQCKLLQQMDDLAQSVWRRTFPREPIPSLKSVEEALHALQQASLENLQQAIEDLWNALSAVRAHRLGHYEFLDGWDGFDLNYQVLRTIQADASADAVDGWEAFMDGLETLRRSDPVKGLVQGLYRSLRALPRAFKQFDELFSQRFERTGAPRLELSPVELFTLQARVLQSKPAPVALDKPSLAE